jgi:hypothetical protein
MLRRQIEQFILVLVIAGVSCVSCARSCSGPSQKPPVSKSAPEGHRTDSDSAESKQSTDQQLFVKALLTIYENTRAAAGYAPAPEQLPRIMNFQMTVDNAAGKVQALKDQFGEFWRLIAIAKLAASGIEKFRAALTALKVSQAELQKLETLLNAHPGAIFLERVDLAFQEVRHSEQVVDPGVPSCEYTTPLTIAGPQPSAWSATATTTVFLGLTPLQLAERADPQNWDNPCGKPFFDKTFITELSGGVFQQTGCLAEEGNPKPSDTEWHGFVYEDYRLPTVAGDFFANILHIDSVPSSTQYSLTYSLESPLCAAMSPDPQVPNQQASIALFVDDGSLIGTPAATGQVFVTATKTIGFEDAFPHHAPADLAAMAGAMLELVGDGIPYWLCCPEVTH